MYSSSGIRSKFDGQCFTIGWPSGNTFPAATNSAEPSSNPSAERSIQNDVFASAVTFAGSEGILPAPEAAHAIHGTLQVAKAADEAGEEKTILFNLSGHGHFDMAAYDNFFAGKLEDVALDEAEIERALKAIEGLPQPA